ncbi:hypothetical protein DFP78_113131 [Photobacterium lutimaris]|nr:hypothetical protein DFP78_113131 [Photobacterium lutimaris]
MAGKPASLRCKIGIHAWTKWDHTDNRPSMDIIARYKTRKCKRCGKEQKDIIGAY